LLQAVSSDPGGSATDFNHERVARSAPHRLDTVVARCGLASPPLCDRSAADRTI
jgi:hypothetical protein